MLNLNCQVHYRYPCYRVKALAEKMAMKTMIFASRYPNDRGRWFLISPESLPSFITRLFGENREIDAHWHYRHTRNAYNTEIFYTLIQTREHKTKNTKFSNGIRVYYYCNKGENTAIFKLNSHRGALENGGILNGKSRQKVKHRTLAFIFYL